MQTPNHSEIPTSDLCRIFMMMNPEDKAKVERMIMRGGGIRAAMLRLVTHIELKPLEE